MNNRRIVTGRGARATALSAGVLTCTILTAAAVAAAGAAAASAASKGTSTHKPVQASAAMPAGAPPAGMLGGLSGVAGLGGMTGLGGMIGVSKITGLGNVPGLAGATSSAGASSVPAVANLTSGLSGVIRGQRLANLAKHSGITGGKTARLVKNARHIVQMSRQRVLANAMRAHAALANALRGLMRGQASQLLPGLGSAASAIPR